MHAKEEHAKCAKKNPSPPNRILSTCMATVLITLSLHSEKFIQGKDVLEESFEELNICT